MYDFCHNDRNFSDENVNEGEGVIPSFGSQGGCHQKFKSGVRDTLQKRLMSYKELKNKKESRKIGLVHPCKLPHIPKRLLLPVGNN